MFLEVPTFTDSSDHGIVVYLAHWLTWLIAGIFAILGGLLYGDYKIWQEIKKKHVEENSEDAKKLKAISEKTVEKLVENVGKLTATVEKVEESNAKLEENYESFKKSWTNIESNYRHITKALETFNDNTPKIQGGLLDLMNELKAEVKKVEEIKMEMKK